jgi:peptidoglycan/LPS O-acetylase OafA/YrhL
MTTDIPLLRMSDISEKWVSDYKPTSWTSLLKHLFNFILSLLPKFLKRGGLRRKERLRNTSYLDALRGIAAVIVVNHHHLNPSPSPVFGLPTAGKSSVNVFFVISGYVLSYGLLKYSRAREDAKLLNNFASSMFRRWMRLFIPSFVASFIAVILTRMGRLGYVHRFDYLYQQIWDWMKDCAVLGNPFQGPRGYKLPFNNDYSSHYVDPLWTIPLEFRGSIVLYCFCLGTCKLAPKMRVAVCAGAIFMCYVWSAIYISLFLGGMFIADLNLMRAASTSGYQLPTEQQEGESTSPTLPATKSKKERAGWWILFFVGLFLLNQPDDFPSTKIRPWPYLRSIVPAHLMKEHDQLAQHFWLSIGSILFVLSLDNYPALQKPLRWDFSQYLGEVSFGVYVMHVLMMWAYWQSIMEPWRHRHFGDNPIAKWVLWGVYMGMILWAGELFSRIDAKIVRFGKWLQEKTFAW